MLRYYQRATVRLVRERAEEPYGPRLDGVTQVASFLKGLIADAATEHLVVLALDSRNRLIAFKVVAIGGANACAVTPADVFTVVLGAGAVAFVLSHNHPSGSAEPSADDVVLTRRMEQAAQLLGRPMLDHVVIGRDGHFSFAEHGLIGREA